jgi:hypothetical protein
MKHHDKCLQVGLTNGLHFGDGLQQRYNKDRWGARGPLERLNPLQFPRIP